MVRLLFLSITVGYFLLDRSTGRLRNLPKWLIQQMWSQKLNLGPSDSKAWLFLLRWLSIFNRVLYSNRVLCGTHYIMETEVVFTYKSDKKYSKLTVVSPRSRIQHSGSPPWLNFGITQRALKNSDGFWSHSAMMDVCLYTVVQIQRRYNTKSAQHQECKWRTRM